VPKAEKRRVEPTNYVERALARAETFRALLEEGTMRNQADIARHFGLTRARVTQILAVLKANPAALQVARATGVGTVRSLRRTTGRMASAPGAASETALRISCD